MDKLLVAVLIYFALLFAGFLAGAVVSEIYPHGTATHRVAMIWMGRFDCLLMESLILGVIFMVCYAAWNVVTGG